MKINIGNFSLEADDIETLEKLTQGKVFIPNLFMVENLKQMGYVEFIDQDWLQGTEKLRSILPKLKAAFQ